MKDCILSSETRNEKYTYRNLLPNSQHRLSNEMLRQPLDWEMHRDNFTFLPAPLELLRFSWRTWCSRTDFMLVFHASFLSRIYRYYFITPHPVRGLEIGWTEWCIFVTIGNTGDLACAKSRNYTIKQFMPNNQWDLVCPVVAASVLLTRCFICQEIRRK
jgi:hypothetical protein